MHEYQAGELSSFDRLYGALERPLRGFLRTFVGDPAKVADLLQETFLQIHRARATYRAERPVLPWAFGIARNVALMSFRRSRTRDALEIDLNELDTRWVSPSADHVATDLAHKALAELPRDRRTLLLMHHVWGFTFEEIGGVLGIRPGTAKVRAHRALKEVRAHLMHKQSMRHEHEVESDRLAPSADDSQARPVEEAG